LTRAEITLSDMRVKIKDIMPGEFRAEA
jgi:hypothetical protein